MTLWNLIRDFFVQNIFGGRLYSGDFVNSNIIGSVGSPSDDYAFTTNTGDFFIKFGGGYDFSDGTMVDYISLGDWLSTTFTIITLILLVIFLYIFVKWIFKLFAGLLR